MASALSTDLYELTMMAGYQAAGIDGLATFELYVRDMPRRRAYLVAAGLEQAVAYLENLRFEQDEIAYLRGLAIFDGAPASFFDECLPAFRFTGEAWAVPEGTPIFPLEPLLRVTAPIMQAQLVETALLAIVGFQTTIASKAARVLEAAAGRPVVEFGGRRAHGTEAALFAARAAYLAGCAGTSNVEAGRRFGIPVSGTMAHSWVMTFPTEAEAFRAFYDVYGEQSVLLIDTYDTLAAARLIARSGMRPAAVRLDSGNIAQLGREVRRILDEAGLPETGIFVSGDLDEEKIAALLSDGAPLTGFGVGTALSTSSDAPALGAIYKLVEVERGGRLVPTMKYSPGKHSLPGRKQVWRSTPPAPADAAGFSRVTGDGISDHRPGDVIGLSDEPAPPGGVPLLHLVMQKGRRVGEVPPLRDVRESCLRQLSRLPAEVRRIDGPAPYPVAVSPRLTALEQEVRQRLSVDG